jgi:hypothetical protein
MFPLAVAVGIVSGQSAVALGMVAAPCLSLIVVPFAFPRRARRARSAELAEAAAGSASAASPEVAVSGKSVVVPEAAAARPGGRQPQDAEFTLAHGGGFAAAVLLIMFSEQTFLNAGPLLIKGSSGAAVAGFMFNILMIARAPIQLFQAVTTSLLPHLTKLRSGGTDEDEETFHASVRVTITAIAAFAAVVGLAVLAAGPQLMHIAFGKKFDYDRVDLLIVTVGMGLYLSAATLNQAALAQGQVRRASLCWIGCAAGFVVWCLLPVFDEVR